MSVKLLHYLNGNYYSTEPSLMTSAKYNLSLFKRAPGANMHVADSLSRAPISDECEVVAEKMVKNCSL